MVISDMLRTYLNVALRNLAKNKLIAMPLGWILAQLFLQNFPLRIRFSIGELLACFLFLFGIGLLTIIPQTYRAAMANPAKKLKAE